MIKDPEFNAGGMLAEVEQTTDVDSVTVDDGTLHTYNITVSHQSISNRIKESINQYMNKK